MLYAYCSLASTRMYNNRLPDSYITSTGCKIFLKYVIRSEMKLSLEVHKANIIGKNIFIEIGNIQRQERMAKLVACQLAIPENQVQTLSWAN